MKYFTHTAGVLCAAVVTIFLYIGAASSTLASVELGITELSPRGEAGGFAMPASGHSSPPCTCSVYLSPASISEGGGPISISYTRGGSCLSVSPVAEVTYGATTLATISDPNTLTNLDVNSFPAGVHTLTVANAVGLNACTTNLTVVPPVPNLAVSCPTSLPSPRVVGSAASIPLSSGARVSNPSTQPSNSYDFRYTLLDASTLTPIHSTVVSEPPLMAGGSELFPYSYTFASPGTYRLRVSIENTTDALAGDNTALCPEFSVVPPPPTPVGNDLRATPISTSQTLVRPGDLVNITAGQTIAENIGGLASGPFDINIWVVRDGTRDPLPLTTISSASINPADRFTLPTSLTYSASPTAPPYGMGSVLECIETELVGVAADTNPANNTTLSSDCTAVESSPGAPMVPWDLAAIPAPMPDTGPGPYTPGDVVSWTTLPGFENVSSAPATSYSVWYSYSVNGAPPASPLLIGTFNNAPAGLGPGRTLALTSSMPTPPDANTDYQVVPATHSALSFTIPPTAVSGTYCITNFLVRLSGYDRDPNPANNSTVGACITVDAGATPPPSSVNWRVKRVNSASEEIPTPTTLTIDEGDAIDHFRWVADPFWDVCELYADSVPIASLGPPDPNPPAAGPYVTPSVQPPVGGTVEYRLECFAGGFSSPPLTMSVTRQANQPIVTMYFSTTSQPIPATPLNPTFTPIADGANQVLMPDPQDTPFIVQAESQSNNINGHRCTILSAGVPIATESTAGPGSLSTASVIVKPVFGSSKVVRVTCENLSPDLSPVNRSFTIGTNFPPNLVPFVSFPSASALEASGAVGDPLTGLWSSIPITYRIDNVGGTAAPAGAKNFKVNLRRLTVPPIGLWTSTYSVIDTAISNSIPAGGTSPSLTTLVGPGSWGAGIPWGEYGMAAIANRDPAATNFLESTYADNITPVTTIVVPTPRPDVMFNFIQNGNLVERVRYNTPLVLDLNVGAAFALSCSLYGPALPTTGVAIAHAGTPSLPVVVYSQNIAGLTSFSTYQLTCAGPLGATYDFQGSIEVIPLVEES